MQNRLKLALVVAVFFGLMASYGIYNFLSQQRKAAESLRVAMQDIVVAAQDIPAGTAINHETIKKGMIKKAQWPKGSIPQGFFSTPEQLVGKVNRVKILANEPILESRLSGDGAGLTVRLEPGKRAMAIKVDEIVGVSGFIVPDDRVDVIVTTSPVGNANQNDRLSKIVLQNMRVLTVAQNVEQPKDGKAQLARSITIEVTPEEAEKLSIASQDGHIILALRSPGDDSVAETRGSNKRDLLAISAPARTATKGATPRPVPQVQPQEKYRVEVIRGSDRKVVEF